MLEIIKSALNDSMKVFDMATMKGVYLLPFVASGMYLLQSKCEEDLKCKRKLLFPCLIAVLLLLSPLLEVLGKNEPATRILRFYWTIPFEIVVLYCIITTLYRTKSRHGKATLILAVLLGLFCFSRQDNLTYPKVEQKWPWVKAENLYKIPTPVYELCNIIADKQQGQPCRAVFPFEFAYFVRQYDASISMPYGYYRPEPEIDIFSAVNTDEIDLDAVGKAAVEEKINYVILDQNKISSGNLAQYGYAEIACVPVEEKSYVIYQDSKAQ